MMADVDGEFERFRDLMRVSVLSSPSLSRGAVMAITDVDIQALLFFVNDLTRRYRGLLRYVPADSRRALVMKLRLERKFEYVTRVRLLRKYFSICSEIEERANNNNSTSATPTATNIGIDVLDLNELKELYSVWETEKERLDDVLRVVTPDFLRQPIIYDRDATVRLQLILENYENTGVDSGDVMEILYQGADPNAANSSGETGIQIACKRYLSGLIDVFLNLEETDPTIIAKDSCYKRNAIHFAAASFLDVDYSFEEMCESVDSVVKLDILDGYGMSALRCAESSFCKTEILLKYGANPNVVFPRELNRTQMHILMRSRYSDRVLQLYIDYKADVNAKDDDGNTPLHFAVMYEKPSAVKILIANNADVFAVNRWDKTPLDCADANTSMYADIKAREDQWRERRLAVAMLNHSRLRKPGFYPSFATSPPPSSSSSWTGGVPRKGEAPSSSSSSSWTGGGPRIGEAPSSSSSSSSSWSGGGPRMGEAPSLSSPPSFVLPHDLLRSMSMGPGPLLD